MAPEFKESTHKYLVLNIVTQSKEFIEEGQLLARTMSMCLIELLALELEIFY